MENKRLYVDVHILQTLPPSCVNRDDTGSPKTAVYGGVTRARVSSQAWKRAMRQMFMDLFPQEKLGRRTKLILKLLLEELQARGVSDPERTAKEILKKAELINNKDETDAMFFISHGQVKALADLVQQEDINLTELNKRTVQEKLKTAPGIDIALFGRMVASAPDLNTDAAAQVAHAISTHKVNNEFDYFTAVDDEAEETKPGAGHLGTVEFNSSTLYRYATVAVHALQEKLGADTADAVTGFIKAFALSMPTGKQNTFANRTLPHAVLVCLRNDQPVNMVGAFEKPVVSREGGYLENSAKQLVAHVKTTLADFARQPVMALVTGETLKELGQTLPFDELLEQVRLALSQQADA